MGSTEETATATATAADKPSKAKTAASSAPPSSSSSAAATPQPFFPTSSPSLHLFVWGTQHLMPPPCGIPIAYSPTYPHEATYAHPSLATAVGVACPTAEPSDRKNSEGSASKGNSANAGGSPGKSGDGGKANDFNFREGVTAERQLIKDEGELKRERRRQSKRESARRSRLRRQQECEEVTRKVAELSSGNSALTLELENIKKRCRELEAENESLEAGLTRFHGAGVASSSGSKVESSTMKPVGGNSNGHTHQSPVLDSNQNAEDPESTSR